MLEDTLKENIKKLQGDMKVIIGDSKKNLILNNANFLLTEDFYTFLVDNILHKKINIKLLIIVLLFVEKHNKESNASTEAEKVEFITNAEFLSFSRSEIDKFVHPFYTEKSKLAEKIDPDKLYTSVHRYYDYYSNLYINFYNISNP